MDSSAQPRVLRIDFSNERQAAHAQRVSRRTRPGRHVQFGKRGDSPHKPLNRACQFFKGDQVIDQAIAASTEEVGLRPEMEPLQNGGTETPSLQCLDERPDVGKRRYIFCCKLPVLRQEAARGQIVEGGKKPVDRIPYDSERT